MCMCVCVNACVYVCARVHACMCVHVCLGVWACVHDCERVCVYHSFGLVNCGIAPVHFLVPL